MGKATVAFCDMCQGRDGVVTSYEVRYPTGRLILDLCAVHGQPLEAMREEMMRLFVKNGTQGRRRERVVITPEAV